MAWLSGVIQNSGVSLDALLTFAGLLFAGLTILVDAKARRHQNLLAATAHHREIWMPVYERPDLKRITTVKVDLERDPTTHEEEGYVRFVILHMKASFWAIKRGVQPRPRRWHEDVRGVFSLPIVNAVWQRLKEYHDPDFVRFVDGLLECNGKPPSTRLFARFRSASSWIFPW